MFQGLDPVTIIALCALITVLWTAMGFIVNMLLAPVKAEQKDLKKELKNGQALLKLELQKDFQNGLARLERKIDLLLKAKK